MTPIDWGAIVAQAPSIAMALLFAWFALKLLTLNKETAKATMDEWAKRMDEKDKNFQTFLTERDKLWQAFLGEQRSGTSAYIMQMTTKIENLTEAISAQNALLTTQNTVLISHDNRVKDYQDERRQELEDIVRALVEEGRNKSGSK